jgi:hypothetical protein
VITNFLPMATLNDDGLDQVTPVKQPGLTVVIGGCNSIHAHNVVQISGESLTAIANALQVLPPESVKELIGPLSEVLRAIGMAVDKVK